MKRRDFLKGVLPLTAAPFALNGIPVRAMAQSLMTQSFTCDQVNDRALVIIQLHGGNDGLNTLVPIDQYDVYINHRPIIGIPLTGTRKLIELDSGLAVQDQIGLHPDLMHFKMLYDEGKINFIQDVAYTNINGSHFRGTDIWLSGKTGESIGEGADSGWFGRYLNHKFQDYPAAYPTPAMPDPPGLEFGSHIVSLGFHRAVGIPMGLTLSNNPQSFFDQVAGVGGLLPEDIPNTEFGNELRFIAEVQKSTDVYAERLSQVYAAGMNTVEYPEHYHTQSASHYDNGLSGQLKTVARLLAGGCKTKIYLVRMGGFDTHANQGIPDKPSFGGHGALLYHLSSAVKAFQDDLKNLGLEDNVVTVTFSEFGRQVAENGDWGTDHGTSGPMMVIGKGIKPGVTGTNPNLSNIRHNRLQGFQHDYRQVFATLLQDWLGANDGTLYETEFLEFSQQKLDLINNNYLDGMGNTVNYVADMGCDPTEDPPDGVNIEPELEEEVAIQLFPNPASEYVQVSIESDRLTPASISFYNMQGVLVKEKQLALRAGNNLAKVDLNGLASGMYIARVIANKGSHFSARDLGTQKIVVQ